MKNLIITFAVFFLCIFSSSNITFSQSETTMQDILEAVNTKVVQLEEDKGQEVVNITLDLLVNQGRKTVTRTLDPNYEYSVILIGDRRISKLKLSAYKLDKSARDPVNDAAGTNPMIKIQPDGYNIYEFIVTVDDFKGTNVAGHFALLIYHDDPLKKK
jgi:hypothetical protein